jgi:hypothetical protein
MSNSLLTPTVIAKEALMILENNMVMGNLVHRDYKKEFVKIGSSVTIRKPVKFTERRGSTASVQDVTEQSTSLTISNQVGVDWNFSATDLTLTIEDYSERYIQPAMNVIANAIDRDLTLLYKDVYQAVGTAGTTPSTFLAMAQAAQKLDEAACPTDKRRLVLNPAAHWTIADGLKGLLNEKIVGDSVNRGYLSTKAGFDIYMDQNIVSHTKGTATGTPLVNGAGQTGSSLVTDGWTSSITGILKVGDVFTIAGVNAINPVSRQSTGALQQFTVMTSDVNSDGSGNATVTISPAITTSGAYQTVSASPADNAAITVISNHAANLAFHRNAFALVTVPLMIPDSAVWSARETYNNISVRIIKDYDIVNDKEICRLDVLYGVKTLYPELGCRLLG